MTYKTLSDKEQFGDYLPAGLTNLEADIHAC
jgi:hypothetical protein